MSSKKKTETTNRYGWQTPPATADVTALRNMKATVDPSIPFRFAQMRQDVKDSYNDPLGAYTGPAVRDNASRASNRNLSMLEGQAMAEGQFNADQQNFGRQATVAGMTNPQLTQTGGVSTQTTPFNWSSLLSAGASIGSAALMTLIISIILGFHFYA